LNLWLLLLCPAGCFDKTTISPEISLGQLFGWEVVMTFTLISVVYACGLAKPGHGSFTPLVVGLSLVACAGTGARSQQQGASSGPTGLHMHSCWLSTHTAGSLL
jgi:glycerol uptake facilitator-like aquaporin